MGEDEKKETQDISDLLMQVQAGSGEAFASLVKMYTPLLESETARYKNNFGYDDLKDISQGALIAFYRAALAYRIGSNVTFGLFAKVCVVNGVADVLRFINKKSGDVKIEDVREDEMLAEDDPESFVLDKSGYSYFWGKVGGVLSALEVEVLKLYLGGNTYAEIAAAIGKSEKSVDNALRRIKDKIKKNFSGEPL